MALRPAAAEHLAGREVVGALEVAAEQIVLGITGEPAWPTLRAELSSPEDRAAVVNWRLDDTAHRNTGPGPLPWLSGIPASVPQEALPVCPGKESVLEARRPSVGACCY